MGTDGFISPLSERYASKEMQHIFSQDKKFRTWRRLWLALAETEKELGLDITDEQIEELKSHLDDINYDVAKAREKDGFLCLESLLETFQEIGHYLLGCLQAGTVGLGIESGQKGVFFIPTLPDRQATVWRVDRVALD